MLCNYIIFLFPRFHLFMLIFPHKFRTESPDVVGTQCACVPNGFQGLRETAVLQLVHQRSRTRPEISCLSSVSWSIIHTDSLTCFWLWCFPKGQFTFYHVSLLGSCAQRHFLLLLSSLKPTTFGRWPHYIGSDLYNLLFDVLPPRIWYSSEI